MKAIPESAGSPPRSWRKASTPPADAPTATTGKGLWPSRSATGPRACCGATALPWNSTASGSFMTAVPRWSVRSTGVRTPSPSTLRLPTPPVYPETTVSKVFFEHNLAAQELHRPASDADPVPLELAGELAAPGRELPGGQPGTPQPSRPEGDERAMRRAGGRVLVDARPRYEEAQHVVRLRAPRGGADGERVEGRDPGEV